MDSCPNCRGYEVTLPIPIRTLFDYNIPDMRASIVMENERPSLQQTILVHLSAKFLHAVTIIHCCDTRLLFAWPLTQPVGIFLVVENLNLSTHWTVISTPVRSLIHVSLIMIIWHKNAWPSKSKLYFSQVFWLSVKQWGTYGADIFLVFKSFFRIRNTLVESPWLQKVPGMSHDDLKSIC